MNLQKINPELNTDKQEIKQRKHHSSKQTFDWIKEYQWQKGQSGNPNGRPKGKTMKEYARDFLANMSEEARLTFLAEMEKEKIWEMAEGKPKQDVDLNANVSISNVLNDIENDGSTASNKKLADGTPLQNQEQNPEPDKVQEEPGASALQPE